MSRGSGAPGPGGEELPRVVFVSSNGTGLGHVTRSMAIARRLVELDPLFITLSGAAPVVREQGFPVEYVASYSTPGAGSDWRWSRRLRSRLRAALSEAAPRLVVFDGAHPYQGLIDALPAAARAKRVWCRRPMWKPGSNRGALGREGFFDAVLEPGEFAASEDRGPTVERRAQARVVDPIVFCDDSDLLPRADAARELGLDPGARCVLVNLGQGPEVRDLAERCVAHLSGREGIQVAVLSSAIAAGLDVPDGVVHLQARYPISRHYRAIDAAVSAAGYNAYHELIRLGVPSLYAPMRRQTDDQAARARYAEGAGVGLALEDGMVERRLDELLEPGAHARMRERLAELRPDNGAPQAARWLEKLARAGEAPPRASAGRWRKYARSPLRSARKAAPFAVRLPIHAAAFAKQTIQRPPPRTVVLALSVEPGGMKAALAKALERTPDPPERVLVATDSLELAVLRGAGVGHEHVPAPGEAQAQLAGVDYEDFAAARLRLILAERRRPRRVLAVGDPAEEVLARSGTLGR
jgi:UDP:flavonoid glycosyltransferase YjiC (YdhE family)